MATHNEDIDKALLQSYEDLGLGLPVTMENIQFDKPTDGSPWVGVWVIPSTNGVRAVTCGSYGEDEHVGILQVDLNYPLLKGVADVRAVADQVASFYTAGKRLTHGRAKVTVTSCSRSRGREVDGWYRVSMTISWYARVPRNP